MVTCLFERYLDRRPTCDDDCASQSTERGERALSSFSDSVGESTVCTLFWPASCCHLHPMSMILSFFFPLFAFFFPLRLPISLAHSLAFGYPRTACRSLSTYLVLRRMEGNRYPAGRGRDTCISDCKKRKIGAQTYITHTNTHTNMQTRTHARTRRLSLTNKHKHTQTRTYTYVHIRICK